MRFMRLLGAVVRWLFARSIWRDGAIPVLELKYASFKRVLLPFIDLLYILLGVLAARLGSPSIEVVFGTPLSRVLCYGFALVSVAAVVGLSFPALWIVEAVSKVTLITGHVAFILSLLTVVFTTGDGNRAYLTVFAAISMSILLYRLSLLRHEHLVRDSDTAAALLILAAAARREAEK